MDETSIYVTLRVYRALVGAGLVRSNGEYFGYVTYGVSGGSSDFVKCTLVEGQAIIVNPPSQTTDLRNFVQHNGHVVVRR